MKLVLTIIYNFVPAIFLFVFFLFVTISPFVYAVGVPLTVIFVVLKLVGAIDWSWLWVISPAWICIAYFVLSLILGGIGHHVRFTEVTSTDIGWIERHLNWTWVFAYLIWFPLNAIDNAVTSIIGAIFLLYVSGWVIKQKGRSLWWIFLTPVFSPLWLKNKKVMSIRASGEE